MRQRIATALVASALAVGAFALPAVAAEEASMLSPAEGETVKERVTLRVRVERQGVAEVTLRLSQDGSSQASGTASIPIPCVEFCDDDSGSATVWGNRTFDPTLGAPFSANGVCNGAWTIQGRLDRGQWLNLANVTFSAKPAAPTNVKATPEDGFAALTWTASKTPDVVGYRIERTSGGGWITLAEVDGTTTRYEDDTVTRGDWSYRVYAQRPDGMVSGKPAAPCSDKGADLETLSAEAVLNYQTTPNGSTGDDPDSGGTGTGSTGSGSTGTGSSGSGSGTTGGGSNDTGQTSDGSSGTGTDGSGTNDGSGTSAGSGDGTTSDDGDQGTSSTSSGSSGRTRGTVAPPPAPRRQTDPQTSTPTLPDAPEYYYGEGEEFQEEIDYGDTVIIAGEEVEVVGFDENGEPIYRRIPGATETVFLNVLDASKVRMLASGLLFVALALHARRWVNALA